jgi:glucose-6-phosphate 1-dehydrogenase
MKRIIIQYGGTGDLALKKLYPAYQNLMEKQYSFSVLALGRRYTTREEFLLNSVSPSAPASFTDNLDYLYYDMADTDAVSILTKKLRSMIEGSDEVEFIYYLALQPSLYEDAIHQIKAIDASLDCLCTLTKKIVVEKPFGFDLESALRYNEILEKAFTDKEIFRVDHYLGKEFMQNLLLMVFTTTSSAESGISPLNRFRLFLMKHTGRPALGFYEKIGVVRDTIQNHIMQIVTYLTMSEPASLSPEDISVEKEKVLRSISPVREFHMGRYESLGVNSGHVVQTPTYAALKLFVNTYYFADIPIYVRTGKMQKEAKSLIYIKFKNTAKEVMHDQSIAENGVIITIHPELTIDISMNLKMPNTSWKSKPVRFRFNQSETFGANTPEAYEQIVQKILIADKSLFPTMKEITESWRIVEPMLESDLVGEVYPIRTLPRFASQLAKDNHFTWFDETQIAKP